MRGVFDCEIILNCATAMLPTERARPSRHETRATSFPSALCYATAAPIVQLSRLPHSSHTAAQVRQDVPALSTAPRFSASFLTRPTQSPLRLTHALLCCPSLSLCCLLDLPVPPCPARPATRASRLRLSGRSRARSQTSTRRPKPTHSPTQPPLPPRPPHTSYPHPTLRRTKWRCTPKPPAAATPSTSQPASRRARVHSSVLIRAQRSSTYSRQPDRIVHCVTLLYHSAYCVLAALPWPPLVSPGTGFVRAAGCMAISCGTVWFASFNIVFRSYSMSASLSAT